MIASSRSHRSEKRFSMYSRLPLLAEAATLQERHRAVKPYEPGLTGARLLGHHAINGRCGAGCRQNLVCKAAFDPAIPWFPTLRRRRSLALSPEARRDPPTHMPLPIR
jgi:hypothetical protein